MVTKSEVQAFLNDFEVKSSTFGMLFRDVRQKNTQALFDLELTRQKRIEIVQSIIWSDYSEGPNDDVLHGIASLWVFGKTHKKTEIYIKISMGPKDDPAICISFHPAERPMTYPLKPTI
ncbi:hypothetical protein [Pedobacter agri]|uniref:hypothetical protein n=1 Tax=Pedobacter agri TaxID=454586 RepID=UPI002784F23A|nr:hypothetical protein [Pedobacter agri]MDQ1142826.1 hypothetical protein [Pedobacter agri]